MPKADIQYMREELKRMVAGDEILDAMSKALSAGDKVEILLTKQGIKILRVRKGELNIRPSAECGEG
jgi:hypothetical protein